MIAWIPLEAFKRNSCAEKHAQISAELLARSSRSRFIILNPAPIGPRSSADGRLNGV
jgi:hypothetical protein